VWLEGLGKLISSMTSSGFQSTCRIVPQPLRYGLALTEWYVLTKPIRIDYTTDLLLIWGNKVWNVQDMKPITCSEPSPSLGQQFPRDAGFVCGSLLVEMNICPLHNSSQSTGGLTAVSSRSVTFCHLNHSRISSESFVPSSLYSIFSSLFPVIWKWN
jgi:hypothetical protein